jgi:hypothetical protein
MELSLFLTKKRLNGRMLSFESEDSQILVDGDFKFLNSFPFEISDIIRSILTYMT